MSPSVPWLPQNFAEWLPHWQATAFFLATFVLEDVAAIGAGLLLAVGVITWPAAFWGCFLGIWFGDAGLYALARFGGRSWFDRSAFRRFGPRVAESEQWFARRGTPILIFSRVLPGMRLPTYLAAGFLKMPANRFLGVTGLASLLWTLVILSASQVFGVRLTGWFSAMKQTGWILLGGLLLAWCVIHLARRGLRAANWKRVLDACGRWRRWEFWPAWLFYPPVALYCVWLALKYRGLTLVTAANPGIAAGGIIGESKMATLRQLAASSPEFTAEGELLAGTTAEARYQSLREILERLGLTTPFILKPDIGQRGAGVKLIKRFEQAEAYLRQTSAPLLVQRYAAGPREAGVFYYRFPHAPLGRLFAITEKVFPFVTGDGRSTIAELIESDPRARFVAGKYLKRFRERAAEVLPAGAQLKLVEAGNHAEGCIFRDGMRLATPELEARIDEISQKLPGFYIGRYDIRYESEEDLRAGKNFQIIELNGAASEATSIYDARNSLWTAYRVLFKQWELVFAIGAANHARGCATTRLATVWKQWRQYALMSQSYPIAD